MHHRPEIPRQRTRSSHGRDPPCNSSNPPILRRTRQYTLHLPSLPLQSNHPSIPPKLTPKPDRPLHRPPNRNSNSRSQRLRRSPSQTRPLNSRSPPSRLLGRLPTRIPRRLLPTTTHPSPSLHHNPLSNLDPSPRPHLDEPPPHHLRPRPTILLQ